MNNPYKPSTSKPATQAKGGRLDRIAYVLICVGYLLASIAMILVVAVLPAFSLVMLVSSGGIGAPGALEILFFLGYWLFWVISTGISWASLRVLRVVAKEYCGTPDDDD